MSRRRRKVDTGFEDDEVKGDMTPMIDIIFLLLIFFLLTTKFIPNEKAISSLLPTNKGQSSASPPQIEPPQDINIIIVPAGMERNLQPSQYQKIWTDDRQRDQARLSVGNSAPIVITGKAMDPNKGYSPDKQNEVVQSVHEYIHGALAQRELPSAPRKEQDPVVINCFSGLPWRYALVAYDAVRAYEQQKAGERPNPLDLSDAREVNFAPPRIRNYTPLELGNELYEIIHKK